MIRGDFLPDAGWPEADGCAEVKTGTERIGEIDADVIDYVDAWTAPQIHRIVASGIQKVVAGLTRDTTKQQLDHEMIERACRAHWPSFDRMRPDHAAEKRVKMQAALAAALYGGTLRP